METQITAYSSVKLLDKNVLTISAGSDYLIYDNYLVPKTRWKPGNIEITYSDNTKYTYKCVDPQYYDIDAAIAECQSISKSNILSKFLERGLLDAGDYEIVFGAKSNIIQELRRVVLLSLALDSRNIGQSEEKKQASKYLRGYIYSIKLIDCVGLTSFRRTATLANSPGEDSLRYLQVDGLINPASLSDLSQEISSLVEKAEAHAINSGTSKLLLDSTNNCINSNKSIASLLKAIILILVAS